MRVHEAGAELDELHVHRVVHAGRITLKVRTCALERSFLIEIVKTDIIGIVGTATAQVHAVVLTDTCLEGLVEPVGVRVVAEVVVAVAALAVASGNGNTGIFSGNAEIAAVLVGIHHVVDILADLVDTEVALVVHLQRLVFLTALGRDDHHTVSSTRTVDGTCRCVLQHLDGLDVVWREVADGRTHGHTVDDVKR